MKRARVVPVVLAVVVLAVAAYVVFLRPHPDANELMASGTVEATEAGLGTQAPGRIDSILVREGDRVRTGQELVVMDRVELRARVAQGQAQEAAARALLAELERGSRPEEVAQAREAARATEQRLADAQRDFDRTQRLLQGGAVSQETLDKAKLALDVAQSQREQTAQQLQLVETGPRPERVAAQRAAVAQAGAMVQQAEAALSHAVVRAPFDGVVTVRDREPGETVGAGAPVVTVMNVDDRWVRIYVREDRLGAVQLGQTATITSDTYPGKQYTGTVSYLSSEAEFTPRNVQTTEERVKLVYAVKVRITGDPGHELKSGMPADVHLDLRGAQ